VPGIGIECDQLAKNFWIGSSPRRGSPGRVPQVIEKLAMLVNTSESHSTKWRSFARTLITLPWKILQ
jgi:hypothetical protein